VKVLDAKRLLASRQAGEAAESQEGGRQVRRELMI